MANQKAFITLYDQKLKAMFKSKKDTNKKLKKDFYRNQKDVGMVE